LPSVRRSYKLAMRSTCVNMSSLIFATSHESAPNSSGDTGNVAFFNHVVPEDR
jgi:hypothetical protein